MWPLKRHVKHFWLGMSDSEALGSWIYVSQSLLTQRSSSHKRNSEWEVWITVGLRNK